MKTTFRHPIGATRNLINTPDKLRKLRHPRQTYTEKTEPTIPDNVDMLNIDWSNLKKVILIIAQQLGVPNIMVIDEQKKMVYYKFMYMDTVNKLNINSIENYVQHQQDILPGF